MYKICESQRKIMRYEAGLAGKKIIDCDDDLSITICFPMI